MFSRKFRLLELRGAPIVLRRCACLRTVNGRT